MISSIECNFWLWLITYNPKVFLSVESFPFENVAILKNNFNVIHKALYNIVHHRKMFIQWMNNPKHFMRWHIANVYADSVDQPIQMVNTHIIDSDALLFRYVQHYRCLILISSTKVSISVVRMFTLFIVAKQSFSTQSWSHRWCTLSGGERAILIESF